jgi:hypothetical protein
MNQNLGTVLMKLRRPGNLLFACLFFSAVCGFLVFMPLFRTQEPFVADFLSEKMLFFAAVILLIIILLISAFYFLMRTDHAQMIGNFIFKDARYRTVFLRVAGVGFILCWTGYFFPSYLMSEAASGYLFWIRPIFLWAGLFFASIILMIRFEAANPIESTVVFNKTVLRAACAAFVFFIIVFIFMVNTGFGISVQEDYWYGAGVPVLWIQIFAALFVGVLLSWAQHHTGFFKEISRVDAFIFILLWLVTAYVWGREPLQPSHFMPDTGINNIYPYSDSATFDIGSQYALIGQGLFNGQYFDRSLYSAFLTYLHALGGQNFETLMLFQAVIYAVFPAILYLLGRELHDRTLGISLGIVAIFRGINAIFGASLIDLAGPKIMLTDFPTAIGISLIILFSVKWLKNPGKFSNVIWAGCLVGLTLLLRTHVILLLPFIMAYKVIYFRNNRKLWIYGSALLILGMLVSTLPLDIQNQKRGIPMFYMYYSRIQSVLKYRYNLLSESGAYRPLNNAGELVRLRHERSIINGDDRSSNCSSRPCSIANHFFHNFAGSVLYLPASFALDDFRHTVKEAAPYWGKDWTGEGVRLQNYLLLFINLVIISTGIGTVWARQRLLGMFPVLIYFVYILSNSLAFTSGGRYLAPVDWIICIYYMTGLLKISFWLLKQTGFDFKLNEQNFEIKETSEIVPALSLRKIAGVLVTIFMIGSLIPITDSIFPRRYTQRNTKDVLSTLVEQGLLAKANLTQTAVTEFLTKPQARLISGRLLYPRFYPSGKGEPGLDYPYTALDYRRLVFMVIRPFGPSANGVILPIENPQPNLHASDVIVLGCATDNFLDAAVVFVLSEPIEVYVRSADPLLQCPLPTP